MFCGSGTIPLEAARLGRHIFASDSSKYAIVLTKGKLYSPPTLASALRTANAYLSQARHYTNPEISLFPSWVREFFNPLTLQETARFTQLLLQKRAYFHLACVLGILHHQRPGFLSYPSSHLVPYLRTRLFPKSSYPDLYEYREIGPRLEAKIRRAYKRPSPHSLRHFITDIRRAAAQTVTLPSHIDCVLTSPPYMNALDYRRDNRLRLWFLGEDCEAWQDKQLITDDHFLRLMEPLLDQLKHKIRLGGYCILILGEKTFRSGQHTPADLMLNLFSSATGVFSLENVISDSIPDIRRSRRHLRGVRKEQVLIFRKVNHAS